MEKILEKYHAICTHDDSLFHEENTIMETHDFRTCLSGILTSMKASAYYNGYSDRDFSRTRWVIYRDDTAIYSVSLQAKYFGNICGKELYRVRIRIFDKSNNKIKELYYKIREAK